MHIEFLIVFYAYINIQVMTKFGTLISSEIPVLIDFYNEMDEDNSTFQSILQDVAIKLGDTAKVIKINIEKNEALVDALQIKRNPTFIVYKNGEMKWRESGKQDADSLINLVQKYI